MAPEKEELDLELDSPEKIIHAIITKLDEQFNRIHNEKVQMAGTVNPEIHKQQVVFNYWNSPLKNQLTALLYKNIFTPLSALATIKGVVHHPRFWPAVAYHMALMLVEDSAYAHSTLTVHAFLLDELENRIRSSHHTFSIYLKPIFQQLRRECVDNFSSYDTKNNIAGRNIARIDQKFGRLINNILMNHKLIENSKILDEKILYVIVNFEPTERVIALIGVVGAVYAHNPDVTKALINLVCTNHLDLSEFITNVCDLPKMNHIDFSAESFGKFAKADHESIQLRLSSFKFKQTRLEEFVNYYNSHPIIRHPLTRIAREQDYSMGFEHVQSPTEF
jgi:hypothetical protein